MGKEHCANAGVMSIIKFRLIHTAGRYIGFTLKNRDERIVLFTGALLAVFVH
jgi:hypothetical protein